eukprot:scaffold172_cov341-Pavlova_lutheri.AAC.2
MHPVVRHVHLDQKPFEARDFVPACERHVLRELPVRQQFAAFVSQFGAPRAFSAVPKGHVAVVVGLSLLEASFGVENAQFSRRMRHRWTKARRRSLRNGAPWRGGSEPLLPRRTVFSMKTRFRSGNGIRLGSGRDLPFEPGGNPGVKGGWTKGDPNASMASMEIANRTEKRSISLGTGSRSPLFLPRSLRRRWTRVFVARSRGGRDRESMAWVARKGDRSRSGRAGSVLRHFGTGVGRKGRGEQHQGHRRPSKRQWQSQGVRLWHGSKEKGEGA